MKNIITTATLLAAGSALACAEITLWEDAPQTASGTDIARWEVGSSFTFNSNSSVVFTVDSSSLTSEYMGTLLSLDYSSAQYVDNFKAFVGVTYVEGTLKLITWQNDIQSQAIFFENTDTVTFALSHTNGGDMVLSAYGDLNFDEALVTLTRSGLGSFSVAAGDAINLGGVYTTSAAQYGSYVSNDQSGLFGLLAVGYSLGSVASKEDLIQYGISAIPEPSAFGLLAGLGALALVGARRRRSR